MASSCDEDSATSGASSTNETLDASDNVWPQILSSTGETVSANTQLFLEHNGVHVITIHAETRAGLVCSKCFKLYTPGSFTSHTEDCTSGPRAAAAKIAKWKDTPNMWADLQRKAGPKYGFFKDKGAVWAAKRDQKLAYVLHPRWCTGTRWIKLRCITDGCCMVLALNGLNKHLASHHKNNSYSVRPLKKYDLVVTQQEKAEDNEGDQPEETEDNEGVQPETVDSHSGVLQGGTLGGHEGVESMEPDLTQPGVLEEDQDVRDGPSDSSSSEDSDDAQCKKNNPEQKKTRLQEDGKIMQDRKKQEKRIKKAGRKTTRDGLRRSVRYTRATRK